jgi:hypothetical protein
MDQQLLDSFNNLSVALQNIADALQKNEAKKGPSESMVADALSKLDIAEQIKSIDEGVKQLIQSNAEIIGTQKTMMESMQKGVGPSASTGETSIQDKMMDMVDDISKKQQEVATGEISIQDKMLTMVDNITKKQQEVAVEELSMQKKILTMVDNIFKRQQEDSEKIETATKALKKKEADTEMITDKKKQTAIKDGIKLVVMIAAGVLAIGLAMKIIGEVDFASVVALGIALPLLAIAFEKIAAIDVDIKKLGLALVGLTLLSATMVPVSFFLSRVTTISPGQGLTVLLIGATFALLGMSIGKIAENVEGVNLKGLLMMPLVLIAASAAIMASSYLLAFVKPIGLAQAFTTIMIGAAFAVLSFSIAELTSNISDVTPKSLLLLPLVLVASSFAIMASSYFLANVIPVGLPQVLTSIAIAATFAVLSFGLAKIAEAASGINPLGVLMLPLVLIAYSYAIMESSVFLSQVQLISFAQFLTSVGIAIAFIPIAFSLVLISKAFEKISLAKIVAATFALPILFVAMSYAIAYSSAVLATTTTVDTGLLFNIVLQAVALAAIAIVMGVAIFALDKLGLASPGGIIRTAAAGVAIVLIAGTIALSSQILGFGDYTSYPSLDWTLGAAASILAFGILIVAAGAILAATGFVGGAIAGLAGAAAVLGIAGVIVAVDKILSLGEYNKYPSFEYAKSVGLLLGAMGIVLAVAAPLLPLIFVGVLSVRKIANTIVEVDQILSSGAYTKYPKKEYVDGVMPLLTKFGAFMIQNATSIIGLLAGSESVEEIASSIKNTSLELAKGDYTKSIPTEWGANVVETFKQYKIVQNLVDDFDDDNIVLVERTAFSISMISNIIGRGNYDKIISDEYNESLKKAFVSFIPIVESVEDYDFEQISMAERSARGIATISNEIAKGNYNTNIPSTWASNVVSLFTGYSSILEVVSDMNPGLISRIGSKISSAIGGFLGVEEGEKVTPIGVAQNIVALSKVMSMGVYKPIASNFMDSVYQNMKAYLKIIDLLSGQEMSSEILGVSVSIGRGISKIASDYDKLAQGIQKVSAAITNIDLEKVTALRALTGSVVLLSLMDADQFEDVMDALEEKSEILGDLLTKAGGINPELPSVKTATVATSEGPGINEVLELMAQIDKKLSVIAASSNNISSYVNEIRSSPSKVGLRR